MSSLVQYWLGGELEWQLSALGLLPEAAGVAAVVVGPVRNSALQDGDDGHSNALPDPSSTGPQISAGPTSPEEAGKRNLRDAVFDIALPIDWTTEEFEPEGQSGQTWVVTAPKQSAQAEADVG